MTDWKYQTDTVYLAPYNQELALAQEGLLGHLYLRLKADGLVPTAFPGNPDMQFDRFVSYLSGDKVGVQIYYIKGETAEAPMIPAGFCFLYGVDGEPGQRMAYFGFCFFREFWGTKEIKELGWLCLNYWLEAIGVDVLYGYTLEDNRLAEQFCRQYGFEEIAVMPKFLRSTNGRVDARIVLLEKQKFLKLWEQHRS